MNICDLVASPTNSISSYIVTHKNIFVSILKHFADVKFLIVNQIKFSIICFFFCFRVKFLCEVDVKEFYRAEHEMDDTDINDDTNESRGIVTLMTGVFCVAITVMLPWYIIGVN